MTTDKKDNVVSLTVRRNKRAVGTVDLTPTDEGYRMMVRLFREQKGENDEHIRMITTWLDRVDDGGDYDCSPIFKLVEIALHDLLAKKESANTEFQATIDEIETYLARKGGA